ncbi:hypothetical protein C942_00192 [Photobacterium marinum]|uniref:Lipoprotein n=1 Tax=Photobacterium marinum TaxID=1056511 RepID=L8JK57_9GAMM|nr:hypothetical protein [Photobacterium marinum]ELR67884.1 hypothetical protein C942_00192 [Photobacterium marinum]
MKKSTLLLSTALITSTSPLSWACSYDGQFNNPFSESYPGSLDIAIATQQAIRAQSIERPQSLEGQKGLRRASWWLNLMVGLYPELPSDTYIYLVDSKLWSKYQSDKKLSVHVDAPDAGAQILLISEAALHNLVIKKITFNTAIELGLIIQS